MKFRALEGVVKLYHKGYPILAHSPALFYFTSPWVVKDEEGAHLSAYPPRVAWNAAGAHLVNLK